LIEWPERGLGGLPECDLDIELSVEGNGRLASLHGISVDGQRWLTTL
jgi:tRNA A37 threonylcarbamoyladenosine biosynthesis protein TsaE